MVIIMSREHKKFERLFLFSEVAKQLSFTEAAASLGISRGYLSEQIRQLEKEVGRPLLIRTTRSVRLTPQGEMILSSMGQVKADLLMLDKRIRHDNDDISGRIRITAPSQLTQRHLLNICHEFTQLHPQVHFSIVTILISHLGLPQHHRKTWSLKSYLIISKSVVRPQRIFNNMGHLIRLRICNITYA
jgi:molybdenum-dependent DNA-binding transcriptional regulator ModE